MLPTQIQWPERLYAAQILRTQMHYSAVERLFPSRGPIPSFISVEKLSVDRGLSKPPDLSLISVQLIPSCNACASRNARRANDSASCSLKNAGTHFLSRTYHLRVMQICGLIILRSCGLKSRESRPSTLARHGARAASRCPPIQAERAYFFHLTARTFLVPQICAPDHIPSEYGGQDAEFAASSGILHRDLRKLSTSHEFILVNTTCDVWSTRPVD